MLLINFTRFFKESSAKDKPLSDKKNLPLSTLEFIDNPSQFLRTFKKETSLKSTFSPTGLERLEKVRLHCSYTS